MTWNVLIFDNEPSVHEHLRHLLSEHRDLRVVGKAADDASVLSRILEGNIHLMFLDIGTYRTLQCSFLSQLVSAQTPVIIFLAGSPGPSVEALELLSMMHVLKPIDPLQMMQAITKARARLTNWLSSRPSESRLTKLLVRKGERELPVKIASINWIEADGNYATLHCDDERHLVRYSIGELEQRIEKGRFLRVNRSALVNIDRVAELRHTGKTVRVVLDSGETLQANVGLSELRDRVQFR